MESKEVPLEFRCWVETFEGVGWFMPAYISMGDLSDQLARIKTTEGGYSDDDLERDLQSYYPPVVLAEMFVRFYSKAPFLRDFRQLIGQALDSYFLGNHHIAFSGLVGALEGIIRKLEASSSRKEYFKNVLGKKIKKAISYIKENEIGRVKEIESVLLSFYNYITKYLFGDSEKYPFSDGANRHGVLHGAFTDEMHGRPLGFLKLVSCLDALTFIIALTGKSDSESGSIAIWRRGPNRDSRELERYYYCLIKISEIRRTLAF